MISLNSKSFNNNNMSSSESKDSKESKDVKESKEVKELKEIKDPTDIYEKEFKTFTEQDGIVHRVKNLNDNKMCVDLWYDIKDETKYMRSLYESANIYLDLHKLSHGGILFRLYIGNFINHSLTYYIKITTNQSIISGDVEWPPMIICVASGVSKQDIIWFRDTSHLKGIFITTIPVITIININSTQMINHEHIIILEPGQTSLSSQSSIEEHEEELPHKKRK